MWTDVSNTLLPQAGDKISNTPLHVWYAGMRELENKGKQKNTT